MQKTIFTVIGVAIVLLLGGWFINKDDTAEITEAPAPVSEENSQEMTNDDDGAADDDAMQDDDVSFLGTVLAGTASPLLDFTQSDYEKALASDKLVVLYFYANWCPTCRVETQSALYPAFNALTDDDVIGFRVNFKDGDTDSDEEALAKEFGVPYQHTKVFVQNGERVLKAPDTWTTDRYLQEISKF